MKFSRSGLVLLFAVGACGGEARKLGEVDVPGGAGGLDGAGFSGAPTSFGGTSTSFGGASGGVDMIASGGGDPITVPPGTTGGTATLDGGQVPITEQQRSSLAATSCAAFNFPQPKIEPTSLELLVDTSASMAEAKPGAIGPGDWELTRDALLQAIDALPSTTRVALVLFPPPEVMGGNAPASCGALSESVARAELGEAGSTQRTLLSQRLQAVVPRGSTPLLDAYQFAVDEVRKAVGPHMILVATDGAPTVPICGIGGVEGNAVDAEPILERVQSAYVSHGVRTMVVGSPGSDAQRVWLSSAAINGGTAEPGCDVHGARCHVDLASNADLTSQLAGERGVGGAVVNCTFQLSEAPGQVLDFSQTSVVLNDSAGSLLLLQDAVGDCATGFQLRDHSVTLCPDSCALARHADVQILVSCITTAR